MIERQSKHYPIDLDAFNDGNATLVLFYIDWDASNNCNVYPSIIL